jgi:hypothetical protein
VVEVAGAPGPLEELIQPDSFEEPGQQALHDERHDAVMTAPP